MEQEWAMAVSMRDFLKNRRDRALGSILGHAERSDWWNKLSSAERQALRQHTIDSLNSYHDVVLDLVKAEDGTRNEMVVDLLERIDRNTRQSKPAATG